MNATRAQNIRAKAIAIAKRLLAAGGAEDRLTVDLTEEEAREIWPDLVQPVSLVGQVMSGRRFKIVPRRPSKPASTGMARPF